MSRRRPAVLGEKVALIDSDGVLSNFTKRMVQEANHRLGTSYTVDQVTQFDFASSLGMTRQQGAEIKRLIAETAGLCRSMEPYHGAREGIDRIRRIMPVLAVTTPWYTSPTWVYERIWWLDHWFGIPPEYQIHTAAKWAVRGRLLLEDSADACAEWQPLNPNGVAVFWRTPHNTDELWFGESASDWDRVEEIADRWGHQ